MSPGNLLIVEDDEACRREWVRAFVQRGFQVIAAPNAGAARAVASTCAITHATIDARLPEGADLVRFLRNRHPAAVIVVLTAYGAAEKAARLGANHVLSRPADADELIAAFTR